MKSAYRSVMFYIGQKELEMQFKMNRIVGQCRQKCETMQEKFTEKLEQVHTAYQKMAKKCQILEQEIESLSKDNQELQEKFAEKSRYCIHHFGFKTMPFFLRLIVLFWGPFFFFLLWTNFELTVASTDRRGSWMKCMIN